MNVGYKHTWVLSRDSIVIRFYMWLWAASPTDVNFCKLFWGYLFAIPNLIVRVVFLPFVVVGRMIDKHLPEPRSPEERLRRIDQTAARKRARHSRAQRWLNRIENGGVRLVMALTWAWRFLRYPFVVALGLVALGGLAFIVYQIVTVWSEVTLDVLLALGALMAAVVFVVVPLTLGIGALANRDKLHWVGRMFDWTWPRVLVTIAAPFVFFFWVMKMGFISVKSNTCPRVELSDPKVKPTRHL